MGCAAARAEREEFVRRRREACSLRSAHDQFVRVRRDARPHILNFAKEDVRSRGTDAVERLKELCDACGVTVRLVAQLA